MKLFAKHEFYTLDDLSQLTQQPKVWGGLGPCGTLCVTTITSSSLFVQRLLAEPRQGRFADSRRLPVRGPRSRPVGHRGKAALGESGFFSHHS
jgi:hypothetical protein